MYLLQKAPEEGGRPSNYRLERGAAVMIAAVCARGLRTDASEMLRLRQHIRTCAPALLTRKSSRARLAKMVVVMSCNVSRFADARAPARVCRQP